LGEGCKGGEIMGRKAINRGIKYEQRKAIKHKGKHKGGPGTEDYTRGNKKGEVKDRETKVTKPELQKLINMKKITEVESKSGFTDPAIEYRNQYHPNVKLFQRGKEVKKPQKSNE